MLLRVFVRGIEDWSREKLIIHVASNGFCLELVPLHARLQRSAHAGHEPVPSRSISRLAPRLTRNLLSATWAEGEPLLLEPK